MSKLVLWSALPGKDQPAPEEKNLLFYSVQKCSQLQDTFAENGLRFFKIAFCFVLIKTCSKNSTRVNMAKQSFMRCTQVAHSPANKPSVSCSSPLAEHKKAKPNIKPSSQTLRLLGFLRLYPAP